MQIHLPSYESIRLAIDNGLPEDYHLVRLYYSWYAGWFYKHRLQMVADALDTYQVKTALDIGTGSGIFLMQLLKHAQRVYGIDIHKSYTGIQKMLERENADLSRVELREGSIVDIPYPDNSMAAAVCISVLEHFPDPRPALVEIERVLEPGGVFVWGCPVKSRITDPIFQALGYDPEDIHPGHHDTILKTTEDVLNVEMTSYYPATWLPMYVVCRARKRQ